MAIAHSHSTGCLIDAYPDNYKKTLTNGYYWIRLRNDHWSIGKFLSGDWYVCGLSGCLSHPPIEIGSRIERI